MPESWPVIYSTTLVVRRSRLDEPQTNSALIHPSPFSRSRHPFVSLLPCSNLHPQRAKWLGGLRAVLISWIPIKLEARAGFEGALRALQALPQPLGYRALTVHYGCVHPTRPSAIFFLLNLLHGSRKHISWTHFAEL